jgi:hypothetical protein
MVKGQPRQIVHETPIFKNNQSKMDRKLAQAVQCLLYKHKVLSLNPSPTKKSVYNLSLTMSRTPSRIIQHMKKQENVMHTQEQRQ